MLLWMCSLKSVCIVRSSLLGILVWIMFQIRKYQLVVSFSADCQLGLNTAHSDFLISAQLGFQLYNFDCHGCASTSVRLGLLDMLLFHSVLPTQAN